MEHIWNDGGRAACGFVGLASDCAARAIAIATGTVYRDVYQQLGRAAEHSPRKGMEFVITNEYLRQRNWECYRPVYTSFTPDVIPKGVVIVRLAKGDRAYHLCAVIDHVVHDTWNPSDDEGFYIVDVWYKTSNADSNLPSIAPSRHSSREQELTQSEFEKILNRLRALDRTASNSGSTEGEKHNALRMMQDLMLRHNLSREDIVDNDNVESVRFTRMACPLNGRRACGWEYSLAWYVTHHIFTSTQYFSSKSGHRTLIWFYGPVDDVRNAITLYRELLLTIAAAAHLRFGGYSRGSGASYAEGYVQGLPRWNQTADPESTVSVNERGLIQNRQLALHSAALRWLDLECDIKLRNVSSSGRYLYDKDANQVGRVHGSQHNINTPNAPKRITHQ